MEPTAKICERCGGRRFATFEVRGLAVARVCDCVPPCETCGGAGFVRGRNARGYNETKPCECRDLFRRVDRFSEAQIPAKYRENAFESYESKTPSQARAQARLYELAKTISAKSRGVLIAGPVGVGKTHLLVATLRYLTLERGISCRFADFFHLLGNLREGYAQGRSDADLLGPLSTVDVLAIDELGKGRNTDWEYSILDELVSRRYNLGATTLLTTNYLDAPPVEGRSTRGFSAKSVVETLEERVGARIYSRLLEMCEFLTLDGPDHRKNP
ncbi:MAG: ATP-binding protein [Deltaproteobacteria bacterium]|nr:ATP-binding protein [Deltaproteobacteria bacterium]